MLEECLNPSIVWEKERGFFTLPPFAEPERFIFPEGMGPVECVHVELPVHLGVGRERDLESPVEGEPVDVVGADPASDAIGRFEDTDRDAGVMECYGT